jgi:hypothetical protein
MFGQIFFIREKTHMLKNRVKDHVKDQVKKELESLGERAGKRIGEKISKNADAKAADIGRKLGKTFVEQVERAHDALDKETVTKEEQVGVGGKLGTGLGIIGKRLVEKRYGMLGRLMGTGDMVSEGRTIGAKAEKIVKRAVKAGVNRIATTRQAAAKDKKEKGE